ncbi:MAG: putative glycoside hydrolase [Herpetosiphon sp.]
MMAIDHMVVYGRRTLVLFIVGFFWVACGNTPKVTLTGSVHNAYTGGPIQGAQVRIGKQPDLPTDAAGIWSTQAWDHKDTVEVIATGFQSAALPLTERPDLAHPQGLTVTLDVALRPTLLTGIITDTLTRKPIAGARVALVGASSPISATTGTDGRYVLENVPESFQIEVQAPDHDTQKTDIQRTAERSLALRPNVLQGIVKDAYTDQPIPGVKVEMGDAQVTSDDHGQYRLLNMPPDGQIALSRAGYDRVTRPFANTTNLDVTLRPNVITGLVTDAQSGKPISDTVVLASTTLTGTAVTTARSDKDSRFVLNNVPEGASLKALAPGYRRGEAQVKAGGLKDGLKLEPFAAKALYVKTTVAAGKKNMLSYFDIIQRTELNAMVLDLKSDNIDDLGLIYYQSDVPLIKQLKTSSDIMDIRWILAEAKKRNIYTIARIHTFSHDNELLKVRPEWYVQKDGKPYFASYGVAWLDAYDERVWDYNIALGVEAIQLGFDEINFDYIRFPSDGDLSRTVFKGPRDWKNNPGEMYQNIGRFLQRAQTTVNAVGGYVSGDVFGYAAWEPQASIGQNLHIMGKYLDYVCPMVYPSHFLKNELDFEISWTHPYELVAKSMQLVKNQLDGPAARARVRPWLQDFTLVYTNPIIRYGAPEVRAQIDAADANNASGWALWDSDNVYTTEALKPKR